MYKHWMAKCSHIHKTCHLRRVCVKICSQVGELQWKCLSTFLLLFCCQTIVLVLIKVKSWFNTNFSEHQLITLSALHAFCAIQNLLSFCAPKNFLCDFQKKNHILVLFCESAKFKKLLIGNVVACKQKYIHQVESFFFFKNNKRAKTFVWQNISLCFRMSDIRQRGEDLQWLQIQDECTSHELFLTNFRENNLWMEYILTNEFSTDICSSLNRTGKAMTATNSTASMGANAQSGNTWVKWSPSVPWWRIGRKEPSNLKWRNHLQKKGSGYEVLQLCLSKCLQLVSRE